jgi:hypothetical protein
MGVASGIWKKLIPDPGSWVKITTLVLRNLTKHYSQQCLGSGSAFGSLGSLCFWASRIRFKVKFLFKNFLAKKFNFNHQTYFYKFEAFKFHLLKQ